MLPFNTLQETDTGFVSGGVDAIATASPANTASSTSGASGASGSSSAPSATSSKSSAMRYAVGTGSGLFALALAVLLA
jgi:hypothetical protein